MISLRQISFSLVALVAVACGGASSTSNDESSQSASVAAADQCAATPSPTARCAAACPYGYKGPKGTYTCECCTGPSTTTDAGPATDAAPPCCDPATKPLPGREGV